MSRQGVSAWTLLAVAACIAALYLRSPAALALALCLLLPAGLVALWDRYCLVAVDYERHLSERYVFPGTPFRLAVTVTNNKALPLPWLHAVDQVPSTLTVTGGDLRSHHRPERKYLHNVFSLSWYERVTRTYEVSCERRGEHYFGPLQLKSGDVFGLRSRCEDRAEPQNRFIVYPRLVPLRWACRESVPTGVRPRSSWLFLDPMAAAGVRDYRPGDPWNLIHWGATARTGRLQSKSLHATHRLSLALFLDVRTSAKPWQGVHPDLLELAVMSCAAMADGALAAGYAVGLYINTNVVGGGGGCAVPCGRRPDQLHHILTALARVQPIGFRPIGDLLLSELTRLAWGTTVCLVTASDTEGAAMAARAASGGGHPSWVIIAGSRAPVPRGSGTGLRVGRVAGEDRWRDIDFLEVEPVGSVPVRGLRAGGRG